MPLIAMLFFLLFYVVDETFFLSLTILCIYHQNDVFVSDNNICYNYDDSLASILSSILLKSIYLIKVQALFNNYVCLENILSSE